MADTITDIISTTTIKGMGKKKPTDLDKAISYFIL